MDLQTRAWLGLWCLSIAASLSGWGSLLRRGLGGRQETTWACDAALGVALVLPVSAVLAQLGWWRGPAFVTVVALGLALFMHDRWSQMRRTARPGAPEAPVLRPRLARGPLVVLALWTLVSFWTLVPAGILNYHDDYSKYLAQLAQVRATGALLASPLDALGADELGGATLLQAWVTAPVPIDAVTVLDSVLGLLLLGSLLLGTAQRLGVPPWGRWLILALVLSLNPQQVNITTSYLGAALLFALLLHLPDSAPGVAQGDVPGWRQGRGIEAGLLLLAACASLCWPGSLHPFSWTTGAIPSGGPRRTA